MENEQNKEAVSSSTSEEPTEYMLLFYGMEWPEQLSSQEVQDVLAKWTEWFDGLAREGKMVAGNPLGKAGKTLSGANGQTITDGPLAEAKEAIGGYFQLRVSGENEAVEIARKCPGLPYGLKVEVRPVAECCALKTLGKPEYASAKH